MLKSILILLLGTAHVASAADAQLVFAPESDWTPSKVQHAVDDAILAALEAHSDPVEALISLDSENESFLAEPRLLRVLGDDSEPQWMTEGDKLRLRRQGKKFIDITDHEEFYAEQVHTLTAGKPRESFTCGSRATYV
jgi:leucyl aminopeptidase